MFGCRFRPGDGKGTTERWERDHPSKEDSNEVRAHRDETGNGARIADVLDRIEASTSHRLMERYE